MTERARPPFYGLMAEFDDEKRLVAAAHRVREAGYTRTDAFTPMPVEELHEALGQKKTILPWVIFGGAATGSLTGFFLQVWAADWSYPLNVGGRPLNSWVNWVPITFELTILFGALTAVLSMLAFNGLPAPYHPVFNVPGFDRASQDRYFLCIESKDPRYDAGATRRFLEGLSPVSVSEVDW